MGIIIICTIAVFAMAISAIYQRIHRKKQRELCNQKFRPYISDFSVSAYMGRMEAESVKTMQETQKRPKYQLVLWAGLDGLRLNEDGTSEWIRREEKTKPASPLQNVGWTSAFNWNQMQNVSQTENTIAMLQAQLQNTRVQNQITMMQNQMVNAVHPSYMSAYTPYCKPMYYGSVTQCSMF